MTQEEKAKAYDEALERAKKFNIDDAYASQGATIKSIFPELREKEDERIRKFLVDYFASYKIGNVTTKLNGVRIDDILNYLEKQKEQPKEELVYRLNGLMQDYIKEGKDDEEKEHRFKCYQLFWNALEDTSYFEQEEQKPVERSLEDDHIIGFVYDLLNEIEWKDNWAMSKEECLRLLSNYRPQKPAEWSNKDEEMMTEIIEFLEYAYPYDNEFRIAWLKSLRNRPKSSDNWKPSQDQMRALRAVAKNLPVEMPERHRLEDLYEQLKKLNDDNDR